MFAVTALNVEGGMDGLIAAAEAGRLVGALVPLRSVRCSTSRQVAPANAYPAFMSSTCSEPVGGAAEGVPVPEALGPPPVADPGERGMVNDPLAWRGGPR